MGDIGNELERDFIAHLREEKLKQQDKRVAYIKLKFSLVIGIFSIAAALGSEKMNGSSFSSINIAFYFIPFIVFLFDRYILGGSYAIERIIVFLREHDSEKTCEGKWETYVDKFPKGFMCSNRVWSTNFIDTLALLFLLSTRIVKPDVCCLEVILFVVWIILVVWSVKYLRGIEKNTKNTFVTQKCIILPKNWAHD